MKNEIVGELEKLHADMRAHIIRTRKHMTTKNASHVNELYSQIGGDINALKRHSTNSKKRKLAK